MAALIHDHLIRVNQRQWEKVSLLSSRAATSIAIIIALLAIVIATESSNLLARLILALVATIPLVTGVGLLFWVVTRWDLGYPLDPSWLALNLLTPLSRLRLVAIRILNNAYYDARNYIAFSETLFYLGLGLSGLGFGSLILVVLV